MGFVGSDASVPALVRRKIAENMPISQCPTPGQAVGSGLLGVHRPLQPYTVIFPGCTVCCMSDLAFTRVFFFFKRLIYYIVFPEIEVEMMASTQWA